MPCFIWVVCNKLTTVWAPTKKKHVSWQFSGPYGVTTYGSGWRKDVVNQRLESGCSPVSLNVFPARPTNPSHSGLPGPGEAFQQSRYNSAVKDPRQPKWESCGSMQPDQMSFRRKTDLGQLRMISLTKQCTSAVKLSDKETARCNEVMYFCSKTLKETERCNEVMYFCSNTLKETEPFNEAMYFCSKTLKETERCNEAMYFCSKTLRQRDRT